MPRKCDHCHARYEHRRRTSRFCSTRCRVAAARKRNRQTVHFKSNTDNWGTPQDLFDKLDAEFGFETDVCASEINAKCPRFFTKQTDGLRQRWSSVCWMNPPYGRTIGQWMQKALHSSLDGATVVCLVPARTDTAWWHNCVTKAADVRFLKGRLKFGNATNSAPFPSAVVVFKHLSEQ